MQIAYVTLRGRGRIDALVGAVVDTLVQEGINLVGTVSTSERNAGNHPCDMIVRALPDGPDFRISQALGPESKGCRLDPSSIEELAAVVEARLDGADFLVINKFGKQEAQGRGMCSVIARAVDLGIPTLVGVNGLNLQPFLNFCGGEAKALAPTTQSVLRWAASAMAPQGLSAA